MTKECQEELWQNEDCRKLNVDKRDMDCKYTVIKDPARLIDNQGQVGICTSCGSYCELVCVCGTAYYCSVVCQRLHWTVHELVCTPY